MCTENLPLTFIAVPCNTFSVNFAAIDKLAEQLLAQVEHQKRHGGEIMISAEYIQQHCLNFLRWGGLPEWGSRAGWNASMGSSVIPLSLYTYFSALSWKKSRVDIGRNVFPMRTATPWHRLPRAVLQSVPPGHFPNVPLLDWIVLWSHRKGGTAFCL